MEIRTPNATAPTAQPFRPALEVFEERGGKPVLVRRFGDAPTGDALLDTAYDNALAALRLLHARLGWAGWDGKGSVTRIVANSSQYTHWSQEDGTAFFNKDGDNGTTPTALANDVVMHEIGHGVAITRNPLVPGNSELGQALANTFAMALDTDDWKLGEDVYEPGRVYDYSDPERKFASPYSTAMTLIGDAVGRDVMLRVFFEATPAFRPDDAVRETAAKTVDAARRIGLPPSDVSAIEQAWIKANR